MVVWLIGMSGAGKSAIGEEVYRQLKKEKPNVMFLDGDVVREIMGGDLGYTIEDRRRNADRICRLCHYFERSGIDVVCAILSIFHESQRWNREHLDDYFEVFVDASLDDLIARDSKGIYQSAVQGVADNVVGIDIEFIPPLNPDLVLENNFRSATVTDMATTILNELRIRDGRDHGG